MTILWFLIFLVFIGVGIICCRCDSEVLGPIFVIVALICLVTSIVAWPFCFYADIADIKKYEAAMETIKFARQSNPEIIERAAIQQTIVEYNAWLAGKRYWNKTIFDWYIPDKVEELEFMK